jgi:hypothetical protein
VPATGGVGVGGAAVVGGGAGAPSEDGVNAGGNSG